MRQHSSQYILVLAERAIAVLDELQSFVRGPQQATRQNAEWFQPKLAALVAFTGGGVLRPGSISGLFLCAFIVLRRVLAEFHLVGAASSSIEDQVQVIRSSGYDGPLSMVVSDATSACSVVHLIAFKNLRARAEVQRRIGGFRYVLCRAVSALIRFFDQTLRPLLEPKESNKLLFVQVTGRDKGSWVDAKKDGFGYSCGHAKGLDLGTSIRSIRHIVSTEAVRCVSFR